jgi:hypothetical protein
MKAHLKPIALAIVAASICATSFAARPGASTDPSASVPSARAGSPSKPRFDAEALPRDDSKKPSAEEWKSASEVIPTRAGPRAKDCTLWRVREWIRVSCPNLVTASIAFLGGNPKDVAFWIDPPREADQKLPQGGEVMFPVRRGDRRVVQFLTFGAGYEGPFTQLPALVVQEHWQDGQASPTIVIH